MTAEDVLKLIKEKDIRFVDFRFTDFPGTQQHFTVPAGQVDAGTFEEGLGFDASSIRGWATIDQSDMLIVADLSTVKIDPFYEHPTLSVICDIVDPITRESYGRDPRGVAKRAEAYLKSSGVGDTAFIGPELEFFLFSEARYDYSSNSAMHYVDSAEGIWNSGYDERDDYGRPNLGGKLPHKGGYFPNPPADTLHDIRSEMCEIMDSLGLNIEAHHHEVATGGQCEIDMKFGPLLSMADKSSIYKYVVKNVARRHDLSATFMPKPLFEDNGSGMHTHVSIWKDGTNLFAGNQYAGFSETGLHFIAGVLKHARAIIAFTNPTTNSYKRLVPGYEAPVNLAYSARNRSACVRIPMLSNNPKAKRMEFRCPDPSANPYFAYSALLMAGLDGIANKLDPGDALDKNIYDLPPEIAKTVPKAPASLDEALAALEEDHEFLLKGGVFTEDLIENHIAYKTEEEIDPIRLRPHPYEFMLYYDI